MRLNAKIEAEKKQEELKNEIGMDTSTVYVKEKTAADYAKTIVSGVFYTIFVILIFIGLATVINPISREILLGLF